MPTLHELTNEYRALMEAIDAGEIPEEAIADTLEGLEGELDEKIVRCAAVLDEYDRYVDMVEENIMRLKERKERYTAARNRLNDYVALCMERAGKKTVISGDMEIRRMVTHPVEIRDEIAFYDFIERSWRYDLLSPPKLQKQKPRLEEIKKAIESGTEVPGAVIAEKIRIKIN